MLGVAVRARLVPLWSTEMGGRTGGGLLGFGGAKQAWRSRKRASSTLGTAPAQLTRPDGSRALDLPRRTAHQYRGLYTRMTRETPLPKRLGLVATLRQEGVTMVSLGLATALATDLEARFCLVEANWWWPGLANLMDDDESPGLGEVVTRRASLEDALRSTGNKQLSLLPAGKTEPEARPRLARGQAMDAALAALDERFDHVLLDIPAILATGDAVPLAARADGLCLVVWQGVTPVPLIRQALDEVEHLPIRGVVLNGERVATPRWLVRLIGGL